MQVLLVVGFARPVEVPAGRTSAALALLVCLGAGGYVVATPVGPFDPETTAPVLVAVGAAVLLVGLTGAAVGAAIMIFPGRHRCGSSAAPLPLPAWG